MEKHEIYGVLRLESPLSDVGGDRPRPLVALEDGNYITHLGWWLSQYNLVGKKVKITVEEI